MRLKPVRVCCVFGLRVSHLGIIAPPLHLIRKIIQVICPRTAYGLEDKIAEFAIDVDPMEIQNLFSCPAIDQNDRLFFGIPIPSPPGNQCPHSIRPFVHPNHDAMIAEQIFIPGPETVRDFLDSKKKRHKKRHKQQKCGMYLKMHGDDSI